MLECVVNVSEGRRADVVEAIAAAGGPHLLDVHSDPDHHRSVLTLVGRADVLSDAVLAVAAEALARIDLSRHDGVHPRIGAVDVVPFVDLGDPSPDGRFPLSGPTPPGREAREWAGRAAATLGVPVRLYGAASPESRSLPEVRRRAAAGEPPDLGPAVADARCGAIAVGARPALVALNCELETDDVRVARAVAATVRERDGGLQGVRALGFLLASRGRAQVSMNVTDLAAIGVEAACTAVRREASARGAGVVAVELVGLVPAAEAERWSGPFRDWAHLGADVTIEARLARHPETLAS